MEYKEDIGYFYDVTPVVNMNRFVEVILVSLASKSPIHFYNDSNKKIACLPTNYLEIIENIMYQENGWGIKFSKLINIDLYYKNQSDWEDKFKTNINKYLESHNKKCSVDFRTDCFEIEYTKQEIDKILSKYDEDFLNIVDHFTNLLDCCIYRRTFKLSERKLDKQKRRDETELEKYKLLSLRKKNRKKSLINLLK